MHTTSGADKPAPDGTPVPPAPASDDNPMEVAVFVSRYALAYLTSSDAQHDTDAMRQGMAETVRLCTKYPDIVPVVAQLCVASVMESTKQRPAVRHRLLGRAASLLPNILAGIYQTTHGEAVLCLSMAMTVGDPTAAMEQAAAFLKQSEASLARMLEREAANLTDDDEAFALDDAKSPL